MTWLGIIVVLLLILIASLFSAIETAFTAASPAKVHKLKLLGNKKAALALQLLKIKEKVISTFLISYSLVNTIATTVATSICISLYGDEIGAIISSLIMSLLIIVFAEVLPKAIAVAQAENIALLMANAVQALMRVFHPLNVVLSNIVRGFCALFKINLKHETSATEEVKEIINHHHAEGQFGEGRSMLYGVLELDEMTVADVMRHRSQMVTIPSHLTLRQVITQITGIPYSRIPVWQDNKDNIIGMLRARDLLKGLEQHNFALEQINWLDFIYEPWFIPENIPLITQLNAFKNKKYHLALVVDEYGDLQGLLTLEDILEEIVGQVDNEYDQSKPSIIKKGDKQYFISGTTSIRDINRKLGWGLPDEDANTIAGLIIHQCGTIPKQGEQLEIFNLRITIRKLVGNKIQNVLAEVIKSDEHP